MAGDAYWSNVSLLCHFEGSDEGTTFVDSGPIGHTLTANGDANTESSQAKWGSTSGEFPASGTGYVSVPSHSSFDLGTGDFTIEWWSYPGATSVGARQVWGFSSGAGPSAIAIRMPNNNAVALRLYASSTGASFDIASNRTLGDLTTSQWNHVAIVRESGVWSTYINGTRVDTFTDATTLNSGDNLYIGGWDATATDHFIDDFRVTKGVARYSGASLTVPTEAFPDGPGFDVGADSLAASGLAPVAELATKEIPIAPAALAVSGFAPFPELPLSPDVGAAAFSGAAPSLVYGASPIVVTRMLSLGGKAPVASVVEYGADAAFEALTAAASATNSLILGAGVLKDLSAAATVINGGAVFGDASFESLTCVAYDDARGSAALKALTAQATAVPGRVPRGAATFRALTLQAAAIQSGVAYGSPRLRPLTAQATAEGESLISAAATFAALQASGAVTSGGAASAAAAFEALVAEATAYGGTDAVASTSFAPLTMDAIAEAAITSTLNTWAMNTRTRGLTRYPSYPANSFARYNGTYLAAGPSGLLDMQGADSDGVAWEYEVGDHDEQTQRLKRCSSVLFDLFYENPVTVTVKKDGNTSFAYPLPNYRPSVLHQVRVVPGKGLRGRHFQVGAKGTGRFEVHSMIVTMPNTSRRIG